MAVVKYIDAAVRRDVCSFAKKDGYFRADFNDLAKNLSSGVSSACTGKHHYESLGDGCYKIYVGGKRKGSHRVIVWEAKCVSKVYVLFVYAKNAVATINTSLIKTLVRALETNFKSETLHKSKDNDTSLEVKPLDSHGKPIPNQQQINNVRHPELVAILLRIQECLDNKDYPENYWQRLYFLLTFRYIVDRINRILDTE